MLKTKPYSNLSWCLSSLVIDMPYCIWWNVSTTLFDSLICLSTWGPRDGGSSADYDFNTSYWIESSWHLVKFKKGTYSMWSYWWTMIVVLDKGLPHSRWQLFNKCIYILYIYIPRWLIQGLYWHLYLVVVDLSIKMFIHFMSIFCWPMWKIKIKLDPH